MTRIASGLVLFSHGSLLCGSGRMLCDHAERLRETGDYVAVEPGYLNYCEPSVETAIANCVAAGARRVVIVPYFLVGGKFVVEDLPSRLDLATAPFVGVEFCIVHALEDHPLMRIAVDQLISTARDPRQWQQVALTEARTHCEIRSNCPLYGTAACKVQNPWEQA